MEANTQRFERLGFQYYPDTLHYTASDLNEWLPELISLGARWLLLRANLTRAIPEIFITGLVNANIQPIIFFDLAIDGEIDDDSLLLLIQSYKSWGVEYISLFDRPNMHSKWTQTTWTRKGLVDRFLDRFIPLAEKVEKIGLKLIFPALEPGGDYWDTAFLRSAFSAMLQRGKASLFRNMVLGAYAWAGNQAFNWGAGGPERWPGARPYYTPDGDQNQLGFRIFDWYNAISRAIFNQELPILLLGCGSRIGDHQNKLLPEVNATTHHYRNLHIARLLSGHHKQTRDGASTEPIPENVIAGCFHLLAADANHPEQAHAWYKSDGTTLPVVQAFQSRAAFDSSQVTVNPVATKTPVDIKQKKLNKAIEHYLLLPNNKAGKQINFEKLIPYINEHHPTLGYSRDEAFLAREVTLFEGPNGLAETFIEDLTRQGIKVNRINELGISIAT